MRGWLWRGGESDWHPYSHAERAFMAAGPPVEQMSFDFDAEALGAGLTDEDEDEDEELVPAAGTDDADDPEYEVSVPGEDTDTLVPKPAAAPEPAEAPTGQGSSTEDPDPDAEAQQDPKPVATAVHAADTPAATSPAPTAPPQDAPEDYAMAAPANPEAAREDSATPAPPAQPAPEPVPEASPAAQQDAVDDIEVEDPPEPQRRTTFSDLPDYGGHQVYLSGWDGMPDDRGELRREGPVIATLHRTTGGQWYARMQLDPPDVTRLVEHPRTAAEQGAVMYAAFTGAPLGPPWLPPRAATSRPGPSRCAASFGTSPPCTPRASRPRYGSSRRDRGKTPTTRSWRPGSPTSPMRTAVGL